MHIRIGRHKIDLTLRGVGLGEVVVTLRFLTLLSGQPNLYLMRSIPDLAQVHSELDGILFSSTLLRADTTFY